MTRRRRFRFLPALLAAFVFIALAIVPWVYANNGTPPWVAKVKSTSPVPLPKAPPRLPAVKLSSVAQPADPTGPVAKLPSGDANFLPTLVSSETDRLRAMLDDSLHITAPAVVDYPGSVATLVLPSRLTPYGLTDLINAGAVVPWNKSGSYMLIDSVFVAPSASLTIQGDGLTSLLMDTSPSRFTSIVTWEGTVSILGTEAQPISITGWNNGPATNPNFGRPYIRAVGGALNVTYVKASSLGFWSGDTGGFSWTSTSYRPATGGATASSFIGDTYGAFVAGAVNVQFADDLFESNQVDGLRLHRNADNSTVSASSAVRNGADGFVISRGSHDLLTGDLSEHNAGNGFLIDGQALASVASPTGGGSLQSSGLEISGGEAVGNRKNGIIVEGGQGTVLHNNLVCGASTAIAIRLGASDTSLVGNEVTCGKNIALSVGPGVTGTTVSDNTFTNSDIGVMILASPTTHLLNNRLTGLRVFGISVRGTSAGSAGSGNVLAGKGFEPIQIAYGTKAPHFVATNTTHWQRRTSLTVLSYLIFHPLLLLWVVILGLVLVLCVITRLRRRPHRPYGHILDWRPSSVGAPPGSSGAGSAGVELVGVAQPGSKVSDPASSPRQPARSG
jgi:hypothetical protein